PTTNNQPPTTNNQLSTTNNQQPTTNINGNCASIVRLYDFHHCTKIDNLVSNSEKVVKTLP
ncbi:hypothetical protein, partial [Fischerella thermalis]|uniref:hypothetical protein n=1 Tax=Fischerella thermalis TaxID=372787 RepID=UPI001CA5EE3F